MQINPPFFEQKERERERERKQQRVPGSRQRAGASRQLTHSDVVVRQMISWIIDRYDTYPPSFHLSNG